MGKIALEKATGLTKEQRIAIAKKRGKPPKRYEKAEPIGVDFEEGNATRASPVELNSLSWIPGMKVTPSIPGIHKT
jgi:hypothetical protein